ncbi:MAG: leucine-rich repeat domain-containing protein [Clostridiales bacterium]|nr:leucine-rich repeat domain-containing protein [Clostridiales bacterium]
MSFIDKYNSGTWRIESLLGEGSCGKVYKISKEEFGHKSYAALKVIPVPHSSSELSQLMSEGLAGDSLNSHLSAMAEDIMREIRFVQEFKGTANIVSCEDHEVVAKEDEPGYNILMRMELLESLETLLKTRSFGEDDAIAVGADICHALELLAKNGSVHMDVKPENIFFSKHGSYKLGDFGIARQIDRASSMSKRGTLNYMAPEVFKRLEYGTSSDLYSLGLILYRILNNGRMPFVPASASALAPSDQDKLFERRMSGEPLPPLVFASPELSEVILKACAFDQESRFKTALEMRMALEACKPREIVLPPEPKSEPVSESKPVLDPKPVPNPKPVLEPKPVPEPRPVPKPLPVSQPRPVSEPLPAPESKSPHGVPNGTALVSNNPSPNGAKSSFEITWDPEPKVSSNPKSAKSQLMLLIGMILTFLTVSAIIVLPGINGFSANASVDVAPLPTAYAPTPTATPSPIPQKEYIEINGRQYRTTIDSITLSYEQLTDDDLSNLKLLTNLREILLPNSSIKDLGPISNLTNLTTLFLTGNNISDISPLANLNNLTQLYIGNNPIADISPIFTLDKLDTLDLDLIQNISDYSFLSKFSSLRSLSLNEAAISDILFVSEIANMEVLCLNNNQIDDISPLSNLSNMDWLELSCNQITDISPLSNLSILDWLVLKNNQITDVSPLSNLSNLSVLKLQNNQITDISPLSNLTNLSTLNLENNQIQDVSYLANLTNLRALFLNGNPISQAQLSALKSALPNCMIDFE